MNYNYCRTCGSKVLVKSVCHYCGCPPWKGNEFCGNCGSATKSLAILCVNCGTSFKNTSRTSFIILSGIALVLILSWAAYFIFNKSSSTTKNNVTTSYTKNNTDTIAAKENKNGLTQTIINKPAIPDQQKKENANDKKENTQQPLSTIAEVKNNAPVKKSSANIFSFKELDEYTIDCAFYSQKSNPSSVLFFKTKSLGYVKANGKIHQLKLKLQDEAEGILKFTGSEYEVMVEIEGLSGNENDWISSGTLSLSGLKDGTMSRYKIYSSCISFK